MILNIDFDGTCVTHAFPDLGAEIGAAPVLKQLTDNGHQLILFTMRSDNNSLPVTSNDPNIQVVRGNFLQQAVDWFKSHDIPLYGIQTNPDQHTWTTSPKSYANKMIDDSAIGCPTITITDISDKPFLDWVVMLRLLCREGLITEYQMVTLRKKVLDVLNSY